jgi:2-phospho-L-lactate guanylyltransferase
VRGAWVVIPSQGFERGKSRLAPVLGPAERRAFSRRSFLTVLRAAREAVGARHVVVVSASAEVLGLARRSGGTGLVERRPHLNASVEAGVREARRRGARVTVVIHADLPRLKSTDVQAMLRGGLALAPDRQKSGTNAVAVPSDHAFTFRFGLDSFGKHRAEARRRRLHARVVATRGLSSDVDTPEDLRALGSV